MYRLLDGTRGGKKWVRRGSDLHVYSYIYLYTRSYVRPLSSLLLLCMAGTPLVSPWWRKRSTMTGSRLCNCVRTVSLASPVSMYRMERICLLVLQYRKAEAEEAAREKVRSRFDINWGQMLMWVCVLYVWLYYK